MPKAMLFVVVLCMFAIGGWAEATTPLGGFENEEFDVRDIGTFDMAGSRYRVWESLNNDTAKSARQWQFLVEPLFLPERNDQNLIATMLEGNVVAFNVDLWNTMAIDKAFTVIKDAHPLNKDDILEASIHPMPIHSIHLECVDLTNEFPDASFISADFPLAGLQHAITARIRAASPEEAARIAQSLNHWQVEYTVSYSAQQAQRMVVKIESSGAYTNDFEAMLNGIPPDNTANNAWYVFRGDFRKFLESHRSELSAYVKVDSGTLADPEAFVQILLGDFERRFDNFLSYDLATLSDNAKRATFNIHDIDPTEVTKELNKVYTKNQGEDNFSVNVSGSASLGFLGLISGSADGKYNKDEIKRYLSENDVMAEWDGTKWIAQSVKVHQLNTTAITSLFSDFMEYSKVLPAEIKSPQGLMDFSNQTEGASNLSGRVLSIENELKIYDALPAGTVLPYVGDPVKLTGTNWVICNAANAAKYPGVPNLENRFLISAGAQGVGQFGGIDHLPAIPGSSQHFVIPLNYYDPGRGGRDAAQVSGSNCHPGQVTFDVNSPGFNFGETRPPFYTVFYIIKIR